jgi:hypothetical protein
MYVTVMDLSKGAEESHEKSEDDPAFFRDMNPELPEYAIGVIITRLQILVKKKEKVEYGTYSQGQ